MKDNRLTFALIVVFCITLLLTAVNIKQSEQIEELIDDPKFNSMEARKENNVELIHIFDEVFKTKTLDEWKPILAGHTPGL